MATIKKNTNPSIIELAAQSHENQDYFLSHILNKEIPITYRDAKGNLVIELPNGKVELIQEST
ncbi:MAG: hypothetical protein CL942_08765 [Desulfovibrio sp.]|nr:hypothetical protein [Desulfovibrio sp.]|tara:strand:+ start:217 stop:405 length:189 start_codon:yes stop_codon:yes gene_type:complete